MTDNTRFTLDNADGYTQAELEHLNAEWVRRGGPWISDKSEADHLADTILRLHDSASAETELRPTLRALWFRHGASALARALRQELSGEGSAGIDGLSPEEESQWERALEALESLAAKIT